MTRPRKKIPSQAGFEPGTFRSGGGRLTTRPARRLIGKKDGTPETVAACWLPLCISGADVPRQIIIIVITIIIIIIIIITIYTNYVVRVC